jgi:hypothetical protein
MERRTFISSITLGVLAAPLAVEAQQAAKIARIGWLGINLAASPHLLEAFRQGLRDLGYIEGRSALGPQGPDGHAAPGDPRGVP